MDVQLVALSVVGDDMEDLLSREELVRDADYLAEIAGRECYQSFDRPSEKTATNVTYLANILRQEHYSVLEHGSITLRIIGVSRALTHELVRHRHFSYSQLSQRFVDADFMDYVIHPEFSTIQDKDSRERVSDILSEVWETCLEAYEELQDILQKAGKDRKQQNQAARMVLPNMTETRIIVTGNHRAWREFFVKRSSAGADTEIQELTKKCVEILVQFAPHIWQDLVPIPESSS